jgi:hypothetical protein
MAISLALGCTVTHDKFLYAFTKKRKELFLGGRRAPSAGPAHREQPNASRTAQLPTCSS